MIGNVIIFYVVQDDILRNTGQCNQVLQYGMYARYTSGTAPEIATMRNAGEHTEVYVDGIYARELKVASCEKSRTGHVTHSIIGDPTSCHASCSQSLPEDRQEESNCKKDRRHSSDH